MGKATATTNIKKITHKSQKQEPMIAIDNLTVSFGQKEAVSQVSFNLKRGKILGLFGISGAGKTTVVRVITCQIPKKKWSGNVRAASLDPSKGKIVQKKLLNRIGYVPQLEGNNLYQNLTPLQNAIIFGSTYNFTKNQVREKITALFQIMDIPEDTISNPVSKMSGGEKKRLSICLGLLNNPDILFLDEPTTGVDKSKCHQIMQYIVKLNLELGITLLIVTHDLETVHICDQIGIMKQGKMMAYGNYSQLIRKLPSQGYSARINFQSLSKQETAILRKMREVAILIRTGRRSLELIPRNYSSDFTKILDKINQLNLQITEINQGNFSFESYFRLTVEDQAKLTATSTDIKAKTPLKKVQTPIIKNLENSPTISEDTQPISDYAYSPGTNKKLIDLPITSKAIAVKKITVWAGGKRIISKCSLNLLRGEILLVLGESGAGKSTFVKALLGMRKYTGNIQLLGLNIPNKKEFKHLSYLYGYVPQDLSRIYQHLTILENMQAFGKQYGLSKSEIHNRSIEILEVLEIDEFAKTVVKNLSGGQKRRVSVAIALIHQPKICILDEPTSGLDPVVRQNLWLTLVGLNEKFNTTMVVISHYPDEARFCHKVAIFARNKGLVDFGHPEELLGVLPGKGKALRIESFRPIEELRTGILESSEEILPSHLLELSHDQEYLVFTDLSTNQMTKRLNATESLLKGKIRFISYENIKLEHFFRYRFIEVE